MKLDCIIIYFFIFIFQSIMTMQESKQFKGYIPVELIKKIGIYYVQNFIEDKWNPLHHKNITNRIYALYCIFFPLFMPEERTIFLRILDEKWSICFKRDQDIPEKSIAIFNQKTKGPPLYAREIFFPRYSCIDQLSKKGMFILHLEDKRLHVSKFVYMKNLIGLSTITPHIANECIDLQFVENGLEIVRKQDVENFKSVASCNFSQNNISDLGAAFSNLNKLNNFVIMWNKIKNLKADDFKDDLQLQTIILSHNHIKALNGSMRNLPALTECDLRCNNIQKISKKEFHNTPQLRTIKLDFNPLTTIKTTFQHLRYLQELHLDHNQITEIDLHAFKGLVELKKLYLQNNKLTHLNGILKPLTALEILDIDYNQLEDIDIDEFACCTNLQVARICHNNISMEYQYRAHTTYPNTLFYF